MGKVHSRVGVVYFLKCGAVGIKGGHGLLVVAGLHLGAQTHSAGILPFKAHYYLHEGGLAAAVRPQQEYTFSLADMHGGVFEHRLIIGLAQLFAHQHIVAAYFLRGELEMYGGGVLFGSYQLCLQPFYLLELRLGGNEIVSLAPAALLLYNAFKAVYLFLLIGIVPAQYFVAGAHQFHVAGIVAVGGGELAVFYFKGAVGYPIQKVPVVGYDYKRPCVVLEKILKPGDALYVKVIGRLVKQQQFRAGEQHLCQLGLVALAAAHVAERFGEFAFGKAETQESAAYPAPEGQAALPLVPFVEGLLMGNKRGYVAAAIGYFLGNTLKLLLYTYEVVKCRYCGLVQRIRGVLHVLTHESHTGALMFHHGAGVRCFLACEYAKKGGFAAPVYPYQAHLVPGGYLKAYPVEEKTGGIALAYAACG